MRIFDLFAVGVLLTLGAAKALAQSDAAASGASTATTAEVAVTPAKTAQVVEVKVLAPDHLVMDSGSVLVVRGSQTSQLESEVRLTDGSIITPGGTVKRPDGSSARLADGQSISPAGKIASAPVVTESVTIVKP